MTEADTIPAAAATAVELHDVGSVSISAAEISDPSAFLESDRGKAWFDDLMGGVYFNAYYRDRSDSLDNKTVQKMADAILTARRDKSDEHVDAILEETLGHGSNAEDDYYDAGHAENHEQKIRDLAEEIRDFAEENELDLPELDEEEWSQAVRDRAIEEMYEQDDSSVMDLVDSHDRFQMIVRLVDGGEQISSNKAWADWSDMRIDDQLQATLARLGHSIGEYRAHSGNRSKSHDLVPGMRKRRPEIASLDQIKAVVEDACSSYFSIVLFANVRLSDLFTLDLGKPIMLSNCSLASYDGMNGTFFDVNLKHAVEILPGQGFLEAATGYTPDDICGLVLSYYNADLANLVEEVPANDASDDDLPMAA